MKNTFIFFCMILLVVIGIPLMPTYAQDLRKMTLPSGRTYWVHLPAQSQEEHPPLVIALHGGGGNGFKIIGGGHTWPGQTTHAKQLGATAQEIDANQVMWDFFEATLNGK